MKRQKALRLKIAPYGEYKRLQHLHFECTPEKGKDVNTEQILQEGPFDREHCEPHKNGQNIQSTVNKTEIKERVQQK